MPYPTITTDDLAAQRQGLFFGATTSPSLDQAQAILEQAEAEVRRILGQYRNDPETFDYEDENEDLTTLGQWYIRTVLYRAMADVWERTGGSGENPWQKRFVEERDRALTAPATIGLEFDEDDEYAWNPTSSYARVGLRNQPLQGTYDAYFRWRGW